MKSLYFIGVISTAIIFSTERLDVSAIAADSEQFCFLVTASGKSIDLSNSFCHSQQSGFTSNKRDKAFIEEYKNQAMKYEDIRDNLIGNIESSAQEKIEQAKSVCADLEAGISLYESEENANTNSPRASQIDALITTSIATKIYCPPPE